jgi:hypothetical protein
VPEFAIREARIVFPSPRTRIQFRFVDRQS